MGSESNEVGGARVGFAITLGRTGHGREFGFCSGGGGVFSRLMYSNLHF